MTAKLPPRCAACAEPLELLPRGHGKRFCGVACRMAAYRRRQQKISERTPRWLHPKGRLRLSRLRAYERQQAALAEARQGRAERRERWQRMAEEQAAERARWKGPRRTLAELALTTEELRERAQRRTEPLHDDWIYRR